MTTPKATGMAKLDEIVEITTTCIATRLTVAAYSGLLLSYDFCCENRSFVYEKKSYPIAQSVL